jgi:hypothetical protein
MAFEPGRSTSPQPVFTGTPANVVAAPLSERARGKLRALQEHVLTLHRAMPDASERQEARAALHDAKQRLMRLTAPPAAGGFALDDGDVRVVQQAAAVDELAEAMEHLEARYGAYGDKWVACKRAQQNVEDWLRLLPRGVRLLDYDGPIAAGDLAQLMARRHELKNRLAAIEAAPYPSALCKERMRKQIETLAVAGKPNVGNLTRFGAEIIFPRERVEARVFNAEQPGAIAFGENTAALATMAWALKPALVAALDRAIDAEADDRKALSPEDRERQAAEAEAALLDLDRAIAAQLSPADYEDQRFAELHPAATLAVELVQR